MSFRDSATCIGAGLFAAVLMAGCAPRSHELLQAVLWVQTSAEYDLLTQSTFDRATDHIERVSAGADGSGRPMAVVLDIDETVLSNSPYEAELVRADSGFDAATWDEWVGMAAAEPIPGSRSFITRARELGVEVVYVTNRNHSTLDATLQNLRATLDKDATAELLLMRDGQPDWGGDKQSRRDYVESRFDVAAHIGDDLNDFVSVYTLTSEARKKVARDHEARFSEDWFLLPNPLYGSWERAIRKSAPATDRGSLLEYKVDRLSSYK